MKHRPEIDGLRAVAVGLVVFGHAGVSGFEGGFIGVDVFFVISGFLITQLIAGEYQRNLWASGTGSFSLRSFYERRAKRILPMAVFLLCVVSVAATQTFSAARAAQIREDAWWSLAFASNIHFMREAVDYFNQALSISPLQHYWSLSVEEQFYMLFPALFALAARLGSRGKRPSGWYRATFAVIVGLTVASLAWSIIATSRNPVSAYFSAFARAYEIGIGSILGIATLNRARTWTPALSNSVSIAGVALLVYSVATIGPGSLFPGYLALPVTVSAALIILADTLAKETTVFGQILSIEPLEFLGRISFSIYLWHWPIIVFVKAMHPAWIDLPGFVPGVVMAVVALSTVTYYLVEQPARRMQWRPTGEGRLISPRRLVVLGLGCVLLAAAGVALTGRESSSAPAMLSAAAAAPDADDIAQTAVSQGGLSGGLPVGSPAGASTDTGLVVESDGSGAGLATPSGLRYDELLRDWSSRIAMGNELKAVPRGMTPTVSSLTAGTWRAMSDQCMDGTIDKPTCQYGDPQAKRVAVILGDSYALAAYPMILKTLDLKRWRVVALNRRECMVADVVPWHWRGGVDATCAPHRRWTFDFLATLKPDLIFLFDQPFHPIANGNADAGLAHDSLWIEGLERSLTTIQRIGSTFVYLGVPPNATGLTDCTDASGSLRENCFGKADQYRGTVETQRRVTMAHDGLFLDLTTWLCHSGKCPPIIDGTPVFWDGAHFSQQFAEKLAPLLGAFLRDHGAIPPEIATSR